MVNIADNSGPSLDLLPNSVLNNAPTYPFYITPKNGYFQSPIDLEVNIWQEIDFTVPSTQNYNIGIYRDSNQFIMGFFYYDTDKFVVIFPSGIMVYDADGRTTADGFHENLYLAQNKTYRLSLRVITDGIRHTVYDLESGKRITSPLSVGCTGVGAETRTLYLGFPPDEILAAEPYRDSWPLQPALDFSIVRVAEYNPGPDEWLEITPNSFTTSPRHPGERLMTMTGRHPRQYPLSFKIRHSDDYLLFDVIGNTIVSAVGATYTPSTVYTLTIRITDKFFWTSDTYTYPCTLPLLSPTLVELSNMEINAPETTIGTLTTTSEMLSDSFVYTFVDGDGSTHNALFVINVDDLSFIDASAEGTYSCRIRCTSKTGLYIDTIFEIAVAATP